MQLRKKVIGKKDIFFLVYHEFYFVDESAIQPIRPVKQSWTYPRTKLTKSPWDETPLEPGPALLDLERANREWRPKVSGIPKYFFSGLPKKIIAANPRLRRG